MFCFKCGKEIEEGAAFCRFCGSVQEDMDVQVQENSKADEKKESSNYSWQKKLSHMRMGKQARTRIRIQAY